MVGLAWFCGFVGVGCFTLSCVDGVGVNCQRVGLGLGRFYFGCDFCWFAWFVYLWFRYCYLFLFAIGILFFLLFLDYYFGLFTWVCLFWWVYLGCVFGVNFGCFCVSRLFADG